MGGSDGEKLDLLIQEYFDCDLERDQLPGSKHEYHNKNNNDELYFKGNDDNDEGFGGHFNADVVVTSSTKTKP